MIEHKQQPIARFKAGPVSAALWENRVNVHGKTAIVLKASVARTYKDKKTGQWQTTASFTRDEVALAIHALQKCYTAMINEQNVQTTTNITEEQLEA